MQGSSVIAQRFEVVRVLGAGASSRVCLVHDKVSNREVALKVLVNRNAFEESTIQRFREEFEVCRSIRHPHIVAAYDFVEFGDSIAFTVEFVDGEDLGKLIDRQGLSYEEIDLVFSHLLSALEELHSRKITHRDIKPENLILSRDHVLKVADFGLMKRLDQPGMTRAGIIVGTAQYMPPEYIRDGQHDARGDIYAAGMVLYELVTGKRRLRTKRPTEVFELLNQTDFALPPLAMEGVPKRYQAIITKALAVDPNRRFQSAHEMLEAFKTDYQTSSIDTNDELVPRIELGQRQRAKSVAIKPRVRKKQFPWKAVALCAAVMFAAMAIVISFPIIQGKRPSKVVESVKQTMRSIDSR